LPVEDTHELPEPERAEAQNGQQWEAPGSPDIIITGIVSTGLPNRGQAMWAGAKPCRITGEDVFLETATRILDSYCDTQAESGAWVHTLW